MPNPTLVCCRYIPGGIQATALDSASPPSPQNAQFRGSLPRSPTPHDNPSSPFLPNPDEPEPYRIFDACFWWLLEFYAVTFSKLRAIPNVRFSLEITG